MKYFFKKSNLGTEEKHSSKASQVETENPVKVRQSSMLLQFKLKKKKNGWAPDDTLVPGLFFFFLLKTPHKSASKLLKQGYYKAGS